MRLDPVPFERIRRGEKTIELRLLDEKRRRIRVGDRIVFTRTDQRGAPLEVTVTELIPAPSFEALYRLIPLSACGYSPEELPSASPRDMEPYYSAEEQQACGVVGIRIRLV